MKINLTKKQYFKLHGWLGMNFGLLLTLICLSGVVATLSHEIEWLASPSLRIEQEGSVRWQDTYEAVQKAYPDFTIRGLGKSETHVMEGLAWRSSVTAPGGDGGSVKVDPYKAKVVQGASSLYLSSFFRQLHYNFFHNWGYYLVCFISFPLLLSIISGLLFYKKWWKSLFKLRISKGRHSFYSSLHRFIGVWHMIFGLIIGITGAWYFMEITVIPYETIYPSTPQITDKKMAAHGSNPQLLSLDTYVEAATEAFPELNPSGVYLPYNPGGPITVQGQAGGVLVRDRANAVYLDPFDAEVIGVKRSKEDGVLSWWINSVDALHFGYWGGLTTKILWAFFGLMLPALVLSGSYLSLRRAGVVGNKKGRKKTKKLNFFQKFPVRTWLTVPLLLILVWWGIEGYHQKNIKVEVPPQTAITQTEIGPWHVSISHEEVISPGKETRFFTRFLEDENRVANFKSAALRLLDANETVIEEAALDGQPHSMWTSMPLPETIQEIAHLELHLTGWDEQKYQAAFPLELTESPTNETLAQTAEPPTGNVFFGFLYGYIVLSSLIAIGWIVFDRKP